jgi:hypothetical protein
MKIKFIMRNIPIYGFYGWEKYKAFNIFANEISFMNNDEL